jgi:hypothetical protein
MLTFKRLMTSNVAKNVEQLKLSYIAGQNIKYFGKYFDSFLIKLTIHKIYNIAIPLTQMDTNTKTYI